MISEEVREQILTTCKEVAKVHNITALGAYGSRICGYAREDSDYDVLLILEDFNEGVRYFYRETGNIQLAILAVDKKAVEADARKGALGDFVAGRLMSPYIPILNSEFWIMDSLFTIYHL